MSQINLNAKQEEAVKHKVGPLLIIAGAGTGKTQTITDRIKYIISQGWAQTNEILALTFTDKASYEMLDRVEESIPFGYTDNWISTFHSFCDRVIRSDGHLIGLDTNYSLMTSAQSYILFRRYLFDMPLDTLRPLGNPTSFIQDILKHFSRLQDEDITPDDYISFAKKNLKEAKEGQDVYPEILELANCYKKFSEIKIAESKFDFGDLITMTLKLMREKPAVLKKYQQKFKYILVDEFQDTNYAQNTLVNLLAIRDGDTKNANITVVGDDDQAIYKFRGAAISNILHFKSTYKTAKSIVLTENYRSYQQILDLAYNVIQNNNPDRLEVAENVMKRLVSHYISSKGDSEEKPSLFTPAKDSGEPVKVGQFKSHHDESDFIVNEIKKLHNSQAYEYNDIAIIVRSNKNAEELTKTLTYNGIPYKYPGTKGLYMRKEIMPFILFMRLLADYTDNVSAFGLLQMEQFNLSPRDLTEISRASSFDRVSIIEFIEKNLGAKIGSNETEGKEQVENISKMLFESVKTNNYMQRILSQKGLLGVCNLVALMDYSMTMVKSGKSIGEILFMFFKGSGYMGDLANVEGLTDMQKNKRIFITNNISKYFDSVHNYEKEAKNNYIKDYVDFIDYSIEVGDGPSVDADFLEDQDAVTITTAHSAKGLEYYVVFIPHLVTDRFPSKSRVDRLPVPDQLLKETNPNYEENKTHLQEERRLFYVALTRAKEKLYLTCASRYDGLKREKKASKFFDEAKKHLDNRHELLITDRKENKLFDDVEIALCNTDDEQDVLMNTVKSSNNCGFNSSYSALTAYNWCPRKYAYSYLYRIQTAQSGALAFGSTIHAVLKELYDRLMQAKSGFAGMVEYPTLDFVKDTYEKKWIRVGYDSKEHEARRKKKGLMLITNYYNNVYNPDEKPLFIEMGFKYNINDISLKGQIDRVDLLGVDKDGKKIVRIIDYKTGTVKKDQTEEDLQLSLYTLFMQQQGYIVQRAQYYYIEHEQFVDIELNQVEKSIIEGKIKAIADKIRSGDFNATPGMFKCKYCDYRAICPNAELS